MILKREGGIYMLRGVIPVVALPFTEDGKVDENSWRLIQELEKHVRDFMYKGEQVDVNQYRFERTGGPRNRSF